MPAPRNPNARVHLVHLRDAATGDHMLIVPERPGFGVGTRVRVQLSDGAWRAGIVDDRTSSGSGGTIMVSLDEP
jgi:hypothetical protein